MKYKLFNYIVVIFFIISKLISSEIPYPIIFVHGLVGSEASFYTTMNYLDNQFELGPINVFDVLLNADDDVGMCLTSNDVAWEDFIYQDYFGVDHSINLGRRQYALEVDSFVDCVSSKTIGQNSP